jgi:hypothetical protein
MRGPSSRTPRGTSPASCRHGAVPGRVPQAPVSGPAGEGDLADETGLDPARTAGTPRRYWGGERASVALQRFQLPHQAGEHRPGDSGADVPRVDEPAAMVNPQHQRSDGVRPPALAGIPPADDDLPVPDVLDLDPVPAPARMVPGGQRLADHPSRPCVRLAASTPSASSRNYGGVRTGSVSRTRSPSRARRSVWGSSSSDSSPWCSRSNGYSCTGASSMSRADLPLEQHVEVPVRRTLEGKLQLTGGEHGLEGRPGPSRRGPSRCRPLSPEWSGCRSRNRRRREARSRPGPPRSPCSCARYMRSAHYPSRTTKSG